MEEVVPHSSEAPVEPVRSTAAVLGMIGAIVAIPLLALAFLTLGSARGGAGDELLEGLDRDAVHAVYLTNDLVYFGRVADGRGAFFELDDAHFLRRTSGGEDPAASDEQDAAATGETELVPVSQEVGGTGMLLVNADAVVRVQTLDEGSEIARTLQDGDE